MPRLSIIISRIFGCNRLPKACKHNNLIYLRKGGAICRCSQCGAEWPMPAKGLLP